MKFAVAAFLAVTSAQQLPAQVPVVTDIKFNKEGLTNSANYAKKAAGEIAAQAQANAKLNQQAVIEAYSNFRVQEYLGFQKNFSPLVKYSSDMVDAFSPADAGSCNQDALTECLNTWNLTGWADSQRAAFNTCATNAKCQSNFMASTPAQKQELANGFNTSVGTLEQAY